MRDNKRGRGDSDVGNSGRLSPIAREVNPENAPVGNPTRYSRSIAGDPFIGGDPIKQYPQGRRCHVCDTPLSRYNPGPGCSQHPSTKMVVRETPKVIRIDSKKVRKAKAKKAAKRRSK